MNAPFSFAELNQPFHGSTGTIFPGAQNEHPILEAYEKLRSTAPSLSNGRAFQTLPLDSHHNVSFDTSGSLFSLRGNSAAGLYTLTVEPNVCANVELSQVKVGFLRLILKENSTFNLTIRESPPSRFLLTHATLGEGARLTVDDRWKGAESWIGFHADLGARSRVEHVQRTVAQPGNHFFGAQFVVPPHVVDADVEQIVKVIKPHSEAKIELHPWLWIGNRQVAAKHGAAIGSLDPVMLNYLESRGIQPHAAHALLTDAFLGLETS